MLFLEVPPWKLGDFSKRRMALSQKKEKKWLDKSGKNGYISGPLEPRRGARSSKVLSHSVYDISNKRSKKQK